MAKGANLFMRTPSGMRKSRKYQAYCLECMGGGKDLGKPGSKDMANIEATSHMKQTGHRVTIMEREPGY